MVDPLVNPPTGTPIDYPPLFSLLIVFLGAVLKINYFQVARLIQPFMAFFIVLSVSYVGKKFYGDIAGISAGFLILSSYLFSRVVSPLPESLALIFVPLVIYLYYRAINTKNYKYALLSSLLFFIVILTHQETTLLLFTIITTITIVTVFLKREKSFLKRILKNYALFWSLPLIAALILYITSIIFHPIFANTFLHTITTEYLAPLPFSDPISDPKYVAYLGIVLIFAIIGSIVALKRRDCRDIFILVWLIVIFFVSKSYWIGVNVYTIRLLIHLLLPLSIVGGMGLSYLYTDYKKKEFPSKPIRTIFLITIFLISTLFAIVKVTDSDFQIIPHYNLEPYGTSYIQIPQIVPPTSSDTELTGWFEKYGDKKSVVVSNNYETNQFILTTTGQPIADVISSEHVIMWGFRTSELAQKDVGYFVVDKRLNFSSNTTNIIDHGAFIFSNKNDNLTSQLDSNFKLVYQNQNYKVFKIE